MLQGCHWCLPQWSLSGCGSPDPQRVCPSPELPGKWWGSVSVHLHLDLAFGPLGLSLSLRGQVLEDKWETKAQGAQRTQEKTVLGWWLAYTGKSPYTDMSYKIMSVSRFDIYCSAWPDPPLKPHFRLQGWAPKKALSTADRQVGSWLRFGPLDSLIGESVAKKHASESEWGYNQSCRWKPRQDLSCWDPWSSAGSSFLCPDH